MLTTHKNAGRLLMDIADEVWLLDFVDSRKPGTPPRKWGKPGEYIQHLPQEMREILKTLKSDDIKNARWPYNDLVQDDSRKS